MRYQVKHHFANVFKALNDIVAACHGYELAADVTKTKNFSHAYLDLGINLTPNVQTVMHHV